MKATTIALVGDVLLTHRLAPYPEKCEIKDILHQHDCCIGNLEMVVRQDEGWPEAFPGGSHCYCKPACLDDLLELGLDVFSTANNHAMDSDTAGCCPQSSIWTKEAYPMREQVVIWQMPRVQHTMRPHNVALL